MCKDLINNNNNLQVNNNAMISDNILYDLDINLLEVCVLIYPTKPTSQRIY